MPCLPLLLGPAYASANAHRHQPMGLPSAAASLFSGHQKAFYMYCRPAMWARAATAPMPPDTPATLRPRADRYRAPVQNPARRHGKSEESPCLALPMESHGLAAATCTMHHDWTPAPLHSPHKVMQHSNRPAQTHACDSKQQAGSHLPRAC